MTDIKEWREKKKKKRGSLKNQVNTKISLVAPTEDYRRRWPSMHSECEGREI